MPLTHASHRFATAVLTASTSACLLGLIGATTPAAATGVTSAVTTSATAITKAPVQAAETVLCQYRVTADWLRYRTGPGTQYPALGQYPYGTTVIAYRDVVVNGFRVLSSGYWSASQYLQRTSSPCFA